MFEKAWLCEENINDLGHLGLFCRGIFHTNCFDPLIWGETSDHNLLSTRKNTHFGLGDVWCVYVFFFPGIILRGVSSIPPCSMRFHT